MIRQTFFALCAFCIGATMHLPANAQTKSSDGLTNITFLANYAFHGRHSPYFVGLEKGFYRDAGFNIEIQPATGSGFVISAIEGRKADYGMADAGTVVQAINKGATSKAFMVFMDVTTSGLASRKPYPTPKSLAGAKIAASLTDSSRVVVPIILRQNGIDPGTVKWEASDPSVYTSLLLSGQIDLYTASIDGDFPALMKIASAQNKDVHFSSFADWGYDVFGYFLVTQPDRLAEKPDEVKAFAKATARAVQYAISHPEETAKIMVKYNRTLDPDTTLTQWKQSIVAIDTAYTKKNGYGRAGEKRVQRTIDFVKKAFGADLKLSADDVFAQGFVNN